MRTSREATTASRAQNWTMACLRMRVWRVHAKRGATWSPTCGEMTLTGPGSATAGRCSTTKARESQSTRQTVCGEASVRSAL